MATSQGEGKLWIQTSCRPREGWALSGYLCPRHYISTKTGYGICQFLLISLNKVWISCILRLYFGLNTHVKMQIWWLESFIKLILWFLNLLKVVMDLIFSAFFWQKNSNYNIFPLSKKKKYKKHILQSIALFLNILQCIAKGF